MRNKQYANQIGKMVAIMSNQYTDKQRRGIDGVCRVMMYDGSMGYDMTVLIMDWVSKAVANSIVRHMNRNIPDGLDIYYYVEDRDSMEPGLSYWI